jgi:hypothetical protein
MVAGGGVLLKLWLGFVGLWWVLLKLWLGGFLVSYSGSRCGCRWLCCCEWWLAVLAGGCGRVGVDSKKNNNNNKKIIHENSTLNNVKKIYQTKFLFSNLL